MPDVLPVLAMGRFDSERGLTVEVQDPSNGSRICEVTIPPQAFTNMLGNLQSSQQPLSTFEWYGLDRYGKDHQIADFRVPVSSEISFTDRLGEALVSLEETINPFGWVISSYDKKWNGHRYKDGLYSLSAFRYVEPGTAYEPEVVALATGVRTVKRDRMDS